MRKAAAPAVDSAAGTLRSIPAVERVLSTPSFVSLASEFGRQRVKEAVVEHLSDLRAAVARWDEASALAAVAARLRTATTSLLRRVINGTGVIIHTNLGRSPIDPSLWAEGGEVVTGYSNLEFDLAAGERGRRDNHLTQLCRSLFGCQAAVLTNNNAAAVLLLLSAVAAKKEVIVSRGELVEIGGGFRVPEVIQQGGAKLREVGTTNRTRARDYADAVTRKTAAILRVHRSNFDMVGFTETPPVEELAALARSKGVPMLYDEGSGRVVDLEPYGFSRAATIREVIAAGVGAVTCSTDKLLGATQGGLILGREEIIDRCRLHPLMRALRAGKESYAVIGSTLAVFATGKHEERVPIYRMLATPVDELRRRAAEVVRGTAARVIESRAVLGGGTTPSENIASIALALDGEAARHHARFLAMTPPIAGRVADGHFTIDLRTVLPEELPLVRSALEKAG
ncbi:MAG TPA: L-seryl-tRNA(Sec) selenium transferase [Thermoanaerobaculia bacterium]|nr:L-seryl-tRNA(Sec) selenium transferase [Thermoanaerobaculia bacterium]